MEFSVLSSGSKANSVFVSSGKTKVLIDAGLSAKQMVLRLRLIGEDENTLDAIVVTHEHGDHIKGVSALARNLNIPVYVTQACYLGSSLSNSLSLHQVFFFDPRVNFKIGDLNFLPFPVYHDAIQPVSFRITDSTATLVILTDTGKFEEEDFPYILNADALVIESNHDVTKLWGCSYPWEVKHRIAGPLGHLSNEAASKLLFDYKRRTSFVPKIVCGAHISENSNTPDLVHRALKDSWSGPITPSFLTAFQYEATEMFKL